MELLFFSFLVCTFDFGWEGELLFDVRAFFLAVVLLGLLAFFERLRCAVGFLPRIFAGD